MRIDENIESVWNILANISHISRWTPAIKHAAIYGPFARNTRIKVLAGKWDFDLNIEGIRQFREISISGKSVGLVILMRFGLSPVPDGSIVEIKAGIDGWIARIFKKKTEDGITEFINLFLSSLKNKATGGDSYALRESYEKPEDDYSEIRMPTPFNIIYKTRKRKPGNRGSNLK